MDSRIFDCVDKDDVEGLKLLMDYPNIFQIEDIFSHTIFQRAIIKKRIAVFDYLLSLEGCPINARNSVGRTPLQVAVCTYNEHFAYSLLKKGADIDCNPEETSLLHEATSKICHLKVAKLLIVKGADLNCCDYNGETPLYCAVVTNGDRDHRDELFTMMLNFGADPLILNNVTFYKPIDVALKCGLLSESVQEHVVLYVFDDYCTGYDIPFEILFDLLRPAAQSFAPQVIKHITSVSFDWKYYPWYFVKYFQKLFTKKPEYLKLLLDKFDYVIENIIGECLELDDFSTHGVFDEIMHIENFYLLLQSQFSSDVIEIINAIGIDGLIYVPFDSKILHSEIFDLILVLLSYGVNIHDYELENIYKMFGDCEFFRILLHMDIKVNNEKRRRDIIDIMPALLYNVHMDIETFLNAPGNYSLNSLEEVLNYFAHPKLQSFCYSLIRANSFWYSRKRANIIYDKVKNLPSVPLLVELARNEARKFLIQKYKIKNSMQFYTLIKRLPISKAHEKIITLETKLY